jgi:hypothetical protein
VHGEWLDMGKPDTSARSRDIFVEWHRLARLEDGHSNVFVAVRLW